jgi:hypothetical protein
MTHRTDEFTSAETSDRVDPHVRSGRVPRARRCGLAIVATAVALNALAFAAPPAGASTLANSGSYEMRPFVSAASPMFGCYTGGIGIGGVRVQAPSNLGRVEVYFTFSAYTTNSSGQWVHFILNKATGANADSPNPGGVTLQPGQTFVSRPTGWGAPHGYFYMEVEVDWHWFNGATPGVSFSKVTVKPTTVSDYTASYRYQGSGYSYCYQ